MSEENSMPYVDAVSRGNSSDPINPKLVVSRKAVPEDDKASEKNYSVQQAHDIVIQTNEPPCIPQDTNNVEPINAEAVQENYRRDLKCPNRCIMCFESFCCVSLVAVLIVMLVSSLVTAVLYTAKVQLNATFQYLSWTDTYGVLLTEADGKWHSRITAQPLEAFDMHIELVLVDLQTIETENFSLPIENLKLSDDPGITEVHTHSFYNNNVNISSKENITIRITVKRYSTDGNLHIICNNTITLSDNIVPYNCSHDEGGYYIVRYDFPIGTTGYVNGHIDYDNIKLDTINLVKNCTIEMNSCSIPLNWNKKYYLVAIVDSILFRNNRELSIAMKSRYTYYYYCVPGLGVIMLCSLCLIMAIAGMVWDKKTTIKPTNYQHL